MFKIVLFPIDLTREAQQATEVVSNVVQTYQSKLFIISVVESESKGVMGSEEGVAKLLQKAKEYFAQQGIEAETIEREGIPSFTICDVADEINANLIIMGCRGLGLIEEEAADSVTSRVINLAPCPVLVIP